MRIESAVILAFLAFGSEIAEAQADSSASARNRAAGADTLDAATYEGWKQYRLVCDRCHGEEARGTSFAPDLLPAFRSTGVASSVAAFKTFIVAGRPDKGMPPAVILGLPPEHFAGVYQYLQGRSAGKYGGGRPVLRQ